MGIVMEWNSERYIALWIPYSERNAQVITLHDMKSMSRPEMDKLAERLTREWNDPSSSPDRRNFYYLSIIGKIFRDEYFSYYELHVCILWRLWVWKEENSSWAREAFYNYDVWST